MSKPEQPRFTPRDEQILEAIYSYDGMLADYQIQKLFFKTAKRTTEIRLKKVKDMGFITPPDRAKRAQLTGFTVYWLTEQGAKHVAGLHGVPVKELKWRQPGTRWSLVKHDVETNNFRIAMTQACAAHPELELTEWIPSSVFWADYDEITYEVKRGEKIKKEKRGVRPDSYFVIIQPGQNPSRFLLEMDMSSEHLPRFAREKLHAGVTYIRSEAYKQRFGYNAGRWLVVTTGDIRRRNLQQFTERELGKAAAVWYYTTHELTKKYNVLTDPIWYQGGSDTPTTLFESYSRNTPQTS